MVIEYRLALGSTSPKCHVPVMTIVIFNNFHLAIRTTSGVALPLRARQKDLQENADEKFYGCRYGASLAKAIAHLTATLVLATVVKWMVNSLLGGARIRWAIVPRKLVLVIFGSML